MGSLHRFPSILFLLCLFLSGCNVEVAVLGQGQVSAITPNLPTCAHPEGDLCLNAGYNQAVEIQATPAEGYIFAGWAGDCSGQGNCQVRTLGSRQVVAIFKKPATNPAPLIPSMRYLGNYFFSGPWPSDIRRNQDGSLAVEDFPVSGGPLLSSAKSVAGSRQGFARNGSIYIPLDNQFDVDYNTDQAITYPTEDSSILLVNLKPASPHYLQRTPVRVRLYVSDNLQTRTLLQLEPGIGHVLDADTTYGVVMLAGTTADMRWSFSVGPHMQDIIQNGASGKLNQHWQLIKSFVAEHTLHSPENVAGFTVFTTQPVNPHYADVARFISAVDTEFDINIVSLGGYGNLKSSCSDDVPDDAEAKVIAYQVELPSILTGKPPYLLSGGRLNLDSNGNILATDTPLTSDIVISLPCSPPPENEQYPVEIHSLPTGSQIEEYMLGTLDSTEGPLYGDPKAVRVFIAAPHTLERSYASGYQSLSLITRLVDVSPQELAVALADFNPFNIGSIEPQYLQGAMEILYVKKLLGQMYEWGQREKDLLENGGGAIPASDWFEPIFMDFMEAGPDLNDITLVGTSLGALTSLHANAIDGSHKNLVVSYMPRPNASHINNLWDFLDNWMSESNKAVLGKLLGITFPVALNDPFLGLLQTAIDGIDSNNLIEFTRNQNTLLVLGEFDNTLHGGEASYSVASAIDQQFGITPVWATSWPDADYPFYDYMQSPAEPPDVPIMGNPIRVALPRYHAFTSVLTFSSQIRAGNGFTVME